MNLNVNLIKEGQITPEFIEKLKQLKEKAKKNNWNQSSLVDALQELFLIDKKVSITKEYKQFLGGFILGEGSLNLNLKKKKELNFGVALDLEFSVTQSFYNVSHLINLMSLFQTGRLDFKSGSNATFVFLITNRKTIFEKIFTFWETYVLPYQTNFEAEERFFKLKKLEPFFNNNLHRDETSFLYEMLPLWDNLRKQKSQSNQSFASLVEAQHFVKDFISKKE